MENGRPAPSEAARPGPEPPLYERICRILSAEIAEGRLAAGERLFESRLAARFGVSRAPARHALDRLHREGWLAPAAAPSRGYVVAAETARPAAPPDGESAAPGNLAATPTWQRIHGEVEEAITSRIAFGSWRVVETSLGRHYGVSRTVAREVLARLQSRGLVVNEGKRWIAPELSALRVEELYAMRAVLEPVALESAAAATDRATLDAMIANLGRAKAERLSGDGLDRLESELHIDLLGRCTNTMLRKAMVQHQSLLLAHRFFYRLTAEMYPVEPFLDEHLAILDRLASGDVAGAAALLREHLLTSRSRAVQRIALVRNLIRHEPLEYLVRLDP